MHPRFLLLALSAACVTSGLNSNVGGVDPTDSDGWVDPNGNTDTGEFDEPCNGIDDDGDGEIDEGYPDTDGDGIADCVDQGCDLTLAEGRDVPVDEECGDSVGVVEDPWNVEIEWQWKGLKSNPLIRNVIVAPVIGNLTDTNGDGIVDTEDTPNVAFVAFPEANINSGTLVVVEGDTGEEVWSAVNFSGAGGIAMADVNGDGQTEIVGFGADNRVRVVDSAGSVLWTGGTPSVTYPQATVADLDGDGTPEIIADNQVLDGVTGAQEFTLDVLANTPYRLPAIGDLDQDGQQEIILGDRVFSSTGALLWTSAVQGSYGHWSAILDADGDPDAEVAMVGAGFLAIHDTDGTELVRTTAGGPQPGAPCVADFDGDGEAEVA
ncbi:MAG: FG-GAP repeat domain-containing protein, partial [Myxococcota bacterium]